MAVTLNASNAVLLPNNIAGPIFQKATETSAVMALARRVPLAMDAATSIPVPMDLPVADWVNEGGVKPASQVGAGVKNMVGKKVAVLVPVSEEVARTNPAGLFQQVKSDLPTALARAFDYAAINGKSLRTGAAGPFPDYLAMATSTVALGTSAQAVGGIYRDIILGVGNVVDKGFDFTGIAADQRFEIDAKLQTDTTGQAVAPLVGRDLAGYPTAYNFGISGRYRRQGDNVQLVTIVGTPTGGTFVLLSGGNSTTQAFNAAAATLQTAIQAWGGIYAGVTVAGAIGGPYTITFPNQGANVTGAAVPFTVDQRLLTGGTASTSKATVAAQGQGAADSLLRGVGGDFSQAAFGVGMEITLKVSNEASYWDGTTWHSAFQENLVLLLAEAYFGFVMGSPDAFNLWTKGTAAF